MKRAPRTVVALAAAAVALGACGGGADDPSVIDAAVPATVALGVLPDPLTDQPTLPPPPPPPTTATVAPTTAASQGPIEGLIGDAVDGDTVLFIGDATLASAAPPADIRLCDALTLFGWDAEIDTASSDSLGFITDVLDERFAPDDDLDWDVLALFVGNQLPLDQLSVGELTEALDGAIERVAPRPVVIYTLSERDAFQRRFNDVIRNRPDLHDNVVVIDWAELGGPAGEVLELDGVTLTDDGLKRFALYTAQQMGQAPQDQDGDCLDPVFTPDE